MKLKDPKANKIIADKAVEYLKNRMMLNQIIIKLKFDSKKLISFDEFMENYNNLKTKICEIKDYKNPTRRNLQNSLNELIRVFADSIVLTEEQIDDLMLWVRKSIETYGLSENSGSSNETFFIRGVLCELNASSLDLKEEERANLKKWEDYIYLTETVGFCSEISGRLDTGYGHAFSIQTHEKVLCKVDNNGRLILDNSLEDEDLLILPDLYIGYLYKDGNEIFSIFLEKNINGKRLMKAIWYDKQLYPTFSDRENQNHVGCLTPLHKFLSSINLDFLIKVVYNEYTLAETIKAFNNSKDISNEEKEQMETVIDIAANWWVNAVCNPKFDNGDKSEAGFKVTMLATLVNDNKPKPQEETINKFKSFLSNEIRKGLLITPNSFRLSVDYRPDMYLSEAARNAQLNASFPWKTTMLISIDEVSVRQGDGAEPIILYSNKKQETIEKQNPNGPKL